MTSVRRSIVVPIALVFVLALPALLLAHQALRSSEPGRDSQLTTVPRQMRFTFAEAVDTAFTTIVLVAPRGDTVQLGRPVPASADGKAVRVDIRAPLVAGAYRVFWVTVGADGHPTRGNFGFTILDTAEGLAPPLDTSSAAAPGEAGAGVTAPRQHEPPAEHHLTERTAVFDAASPIYVAVRWVLYLALALVIGAVSFRLLVMRTAARDIEPSAPWLTSAGHRAARMGLIASLVLGGAVLLRLWAQSAAMHGAALAFDQSRLTTMLRSTVWGWGWLLQLAATGIAIVGFARAHRDSPNGWLLAAAAALLLSVTPGLSGHAAASRVAGVTIVADAIHVLGAGVWIGGLAAVMIAGVPAAMRHAGMERGRGVALLINAFSPTALISGALLAITGLLAAWVHLDPISMVWTSSYGRVLLLKLFVLAFLAVTGAYNWRRLKPRLGGEEGADQLRRTTAVELGLAVTVLLVTAVLVATPIEPPAP